MFRSAAPRANIPERSFMRSTLGENRKQIKKIRLLMESKIKILMEHKKH